MSDGEFGSTSFGSAALSATPFYNTKTLIDAVLQNTGHATPAQETKKRLVVLNALNNRYSAITTTQHWDWLYGELDTIFRKPEKTGSINVTENSQSIVGVGTVFSTLDVPNMVLSVPSRNETYMISDITSNVALTLEGQYAGSTATNVAYEIIRPIYVMPSDIESVQSIQVDGIGEILPVGRQEFTRIKQSMPGQKGCPRMFTEIGRRASDNVIKVEIYPAPDKNYTARLMYSYNLHRLEDSADNFPLIPDRHRAVLYYGALADMFAYLRDASMTARSDVLFESALMNMRNDTKITDSKIQFQQSRNYKNRRTKRKTGRTSYSASDFAKED